MRTLTRCCLALALLGAGAGSDAAAQSGRSIVYIEDSPAAQELLEEAADLRRQDRFADAAERLQRIIDEYPQKLLPSADQLYEDALLQVRRKLLDDRALRQAYRRAYTATAERRLSEALAPRPVGEAMERVATRYASTEPGLEAALLLAAWYIERADGRSAASVLDEFEHHPDLPAQQSRFDFLQAVAGLLSRDRDRLARHRQALADRDDDTSLAELDALVSGLHPPLRLAASDDESGEADELPESLGRPLWEADASFSAVPTNPQGGPPGAGVMQHQPQGAREHHSHLLPTAGQRRLYINEGERVRALDRNSGWTVWSHEHQPREDDQTVGFPNFGGRTAGAAAQPVLLHGDRAFAVLGHSTFWPTRWQAETSPTALVALSRETGEVIWSIEPGDLHESFDRSNFQGTLIAGDDAVFAMVRRSQASGFQDTFVVALNQRDGALRWRRHLSSAATTSRYATGPTPEMAAFGSALYVSDNIGTVTAIDTRHGTLRWTHVFVPDRRLLERGMLRGDVGVADRVGGAPILTRAGLVVPSPAMEGRKVLLFDPDTGEKRRELTENIWTTADHLLPAGDDVLAVGRTVARFDGETLEAVWMHSFDDDDAAKVAGRASVTSRYVLVPTEQAVVVLDIATGDVERRIDVEAPGNVLAHDGQLVLATADSIRSYLDWRRAAEHLREQARSRPDEPGAGLAMAHLALRAEQPEVALEGADTALESLRRSAMNHGTEVHGRHQQEVFDRMRELIDQARSVGVDLGDELFDRLATITSGPEQEVAYHLSVADHHVRRDRLKRAVEHLQAVLLDGTLSAQLHEQPQVARQAGLEARRRLEELIEGHGRDVYAVFDAEAQRRLAQLEARGADGAAFADLADRYPLSRSAADALRAAGRRFAAGDELTRAAQAFRRAYEHAQRDQPELVADVVGELAELYEQRDRPRLAAAWLERVHQRQPGLHPLRGGEPIALRQWIDALTARDGTGSDRPRLAMPLGEPRVIEGRVLLPVASTHGVQPASDRLLTTSDGFVCLHVGDDLAEAWRAELPDEPVTALTVSDRQILLWLERSRAVMALDPETGEAMWEPVKTAEVLDEVGDARERDAARPREQREFLRMVEAGPLRVGEGGRLVIDRPRGDRETMFHALGEQVIVLADGHGRVVGIDRATGRVQWSLLAPMDEVSTVTASADTLVVGGVSGMGTDAVGGSVLVLDLLTGEPRFPAIEDHEPPQWAGFAGDNLVAVATAEQVTAYELGTGDVAWRLAVRAAPLSGRGWADGHVVLLLDSVGMALAIEAGTGHLLSRISLADGVSASRVDAQSVEPNWHLMTPKNLVAVDGRGEVVWRDAVSVPGKQLVHQLASREHVVVVHRRPSEAQAAAPVRLMIRMWPDGEPGDPAEVFAPDEPAAEHDYDLYIIERRTGRLVAEHPVGAAPAALADGPAALLDNRLVIGMGEHTLVIPGGDGQ